GRQPLATERAQALLEGIERLGLDEVDARDEQLPRERARLAGDRDVANVLHLHDHVLYLGGVNLAAADIHEIAHAAQDAQIVALDFDGVFGVEPTLVVEQIRRVEVAHHRRRSSYPQNPIADRRLEAFTRELHPERSRLLGFRAQDAELGEPVSLREPNVGERL